MSERSRVGGCNCGAVRYEVRGDPLTCFICHCHLCQKRTGSAFSMSLVYLAQCTRITLGEPASSTRVTPLGSRNTSTECLVCRSRLWVHRDGAKSLNIRAGTLDDVGELRPVAQFWISSAQKWAIVPNILSFAEQPSDYSSLLKAWQEAFPTGSSELT
ncbi:GFA family protein [Bradyrhizobium sp. USDA 4461]